MMIKAVNVMDRAGVEVAREHMEQIDLLSDDEIAEHITKSTEKANDESLTDAARLTHFTLKLLLQNVRKERFAQSMSVYEEVFAQLSPEEFAAMELKMAACGHTISTPGHVTTAKSAITLH